MVINMQQRTFITLRRLFFIMMFSIAGCTVAFAADAPVMKVMSYNVLTGFKGNDAFKKKFTEWMLKDQPDIIAYQELTRFTAESFKAFAEGYGHPYTAFMETGSCCPIAISSKHPISDVTRNKDDYHHGLLTAKVKDYTLVVLHLNPFEWAKRFEEINKVIETTKAAVKNEKVIMMGDFNALSAVDRGIYDQPDRLARAIKGKSKNINNGMFDFSVIGQVEKAGFIDSYWHLNQKFSYTCPTKYYATSGLDNHIRIDYIWVNEALKPQLKTCEVLYTPLTHYLSDHYPLLLTLSTN
jgi:exodeoxyribonuclease-3